jgi:hypothetical protein
MKLDLKSRMLPKGYLVNKMGHAVRRGANGNFYCGCKVLVGVRNCDGWCGPTSGPQCDSCRSIQGLSQTRYASLM